MWTNPEQEARVLDQFAKRADSYAALIRNTKDPSLPTFLEAVQPLPVDRMLDVGCGSGLFAIQIAALVERVMGVDLSPAMLDQARGAQADAGVSNVEWRQANVAELPFEDAAFSIVTSRAMLHHVASPMRAMTEMRRVCAPGGRIVVLDLSPKPAKAAAFDAVQMLLDPAHVHAMTQPELRAIGEELQLIELATHQYVATLPLEFIMKTCFPGEGVLERVRRLYRTDAESGADALGFAARFEGDQIVVDYPMTIMVWRRPLSLAT
jgi:ubiquinone/menaquinone biosynthesis C-methylase UbiE